MNLKKLIQQISWNELENKLLTYYPEEVYSLKYYKKLYWKLLALEPIKNHSNPVLFVETFKKTEDIFYETDEDSQQNILVYNEKFWARCLGFKIDTSLSKEMSSSEIVAHMFVDLTYGEFQYELED